MANDDAFERAARREQEEEIRREANKQRLLRAARSGGSFKLVAILGWPYLLWALARAADHWQAPVGKSIVDFLFHSGIWFASATILILVVIWMWLIRLASR